MTTTIEHNGEAVTVDFDRIAIDDKTGEITYRENSDPQAPEDQLAVIGSLRRLLCNVEVELLDAKEALESTRQWDEWQGLKEERKEIQKKLDTALDRTMSLWSQPRML